jgi:membrane fusion protein (multidrug efflux system)
MSRKKIIAAVLVFLAICGATFWYVFKKREKHMHIPIVASIETAQLGSINIRKKYYGKVRSPKHLTLYSEVVGKIVFKQNDGAIVKKKDVIIKIDDAEVQGQYLKAQGRHNEEIAKLESIEKLLQSGYETEEHLKLQQARVLVTKGELNETKARMKKYIIEAPFNAKLGLYQQELGAMINYNTPLVTLTNEENLEVEFSISEKELSNIHENIATNGEIFVISDGQFVQAKFLAMETAVDPDTHMINIRISIKKCKFIVGQIVEIVVNVGVKKDVVTVPDSAVLTAHGAYYIYRVIKGVAVQTQVSIGIEEDGVEKRKEIVSGLQPEEQYISRDLFGLYDGVAVNGH